MTRSKIAGLFLSLALLGGCTRAQEAEVREDTRQLGEQAQTAAQSAKQAIDDTTLEAKVKTTLSTRKGIKAGDIDVEAKNGAVTLKGDVDSQTQADLAVQVAEGTEGVQSVTNQLMVRVPAAGSTKAAPHGGATTGR
jgi:hyperosmotically inducible periplasmic protein